MILQTTLIAADAKHRLFDSVRFMHATSYTTRFSDSIAEVDDFSMRNPPFDFNS